MRDLALMTIGEALRAGARRLNNSETPQLDARILLKTVLQADDGALIARADEPLSNKEATQFQALIERRAVGEPVAYITGVKEFWSLEFKVTPDVLIPRDDSGALIDAVINRRGKSERLRIADLGTGSGCLLCTLLSELPESEGVGVERSCAALRIAQENANALGVGGRARFVEGDWLQPLSGAFEIVIANPPYIPEGERAGLMADVADHEPEEALFAGVDGLDAYRAILSGLGARLSRDALVVMECGHDQVDSLAALLAHIAPVDAIFTLKDLAGRPRGAGFDLRKGQNRD